MTATANEAQSRTSSDAGGVGGLSREVLVLGAVVVLGTIMTVLDLTIVNVAVPTLGSGFHASISTIQWVMTGYMLAFASVIPVAGWASERFGAKRVWLGSLLLFMLGSGLAATAWSTGSLIGFRALQGLGAGMILPVGQTILAQAAGPQRMGRVMTVIGVPMLLAPVLGPVIGGAIVDQVSWRWIFVINLPIGIAAVLFAQRLLPEARPQLGQRLDLRGLLLLSPGIALFLYGMSQAANQGSLDDARTTGAAVTGVALIALFVRHARARGRTALIDISLFARRGFGAAAAASLLLCIALFGLLILLPLYYQVVRHASALQIGVLLIPQGAGAALAMPLAGWITDKIGARAVVSAGMLAAMLGTLAYTQVTADTPYLYLAAALLVIGLGIGSTIMPVMAAAFQTLSPAETPRATSALNAIQRIAGAVGTAMLAIILQRTITANVPGLHASMQAIGGLTGQQRAQAAPALADAFGTTFWVALAFIALTLVPVLFLPRAQQAAGEEPVAGRKDR